MHCVSFCERLLPLVCGPPRAGSSPEVGAESTSQYAASAAGALLLNHAVPVAGRGRDHEKPHFGGRVVEYAVAASRSDLQALMCLQLFDLSFHLDRQAARQHKKELPGLGMEMADLGSVRRHGFFNHRKCVGLHQVPSVAPGTPCVVFRRSPADQMRLQIRLSVRKGGLGWRVVAGAGRL